MNQYKSNQYKSYAKLNRFIHVLKKRSDGYHEIQSLFQLIDLSDTITFKKRKDKRISIKSNIKKLEQKNIIFETVSLIKEKYPKKNIGLDIELKKQIPLGSGLGGGSSNAATTLEALNTIYNLNIEKQKLRTIGARLGADVPFFVNGKNAWVEGKGDILTNIHIKPSLFILIFSEHVISTREMYQSLNLSDKNQDYSYEDFLNGNTSNTFERHVFRKFPSIKKAAEKLSNYGPARMTGSGGTLFLPENESERAKEILKKLPKEYDAKLVSSL
tara:strand:- start:104 stop:919 length:816 start_codon:yes stop_codon:yes gene_type:complete